MRYRSLSTSGHRRAFQLFAHGRNRSTNRFGGTTLRTPTEPLDLADVEQDLGYVTFPATIATGIRELDSAPVQPSHLATYVCDLGDRDVVVRCDVVHIE